MTTELTYAHGPLSEISAEDALDATRIYQVSTAESHQVRVQSFTMS